MHAAAQCSRMPQTARPGLLQVWMHPGQGCVSRLPKKMGMQEQVVCATVSRRRSIYPMNSFFILFLHTSLLFAPWVVAFHLGEFGSMHGQYFSDWYLQFSKHPDRINAIIFQRLGLIWNRNSPCLQTEARPGIQSKSQLTRNSPRAEHNSTKTSKSSTSPTLDVVTSARSRHQGWCWLNTVRIVRCSCSVFGVQSMHMSICSEQVNACSGAWYRVPGT